MNMKNWLQEQMSAEKRKALPVLSFPSIQLLNITVRELIRSSDAQAAGMAAIAKRCPTAASVSLMDLSVEAECFGSEIRVTDDEVPTVVGAVVESMEDVERLMVPKVGDGRTGVYVEAIQKALKQITDRPVFAGVIGPFSLAGRLMDMTQIMINCYEKPEMVHAALEKATQFLLKYIQAYKAVGAHGVVVAEPAAGLLSPSPPDVTSRPPPPGRTSTHFSLRWRNFTADGPAGRRDAVSRPILCRIDRRNRRTGMDLEQISQLILDMGAYRAGMVAVEDIDFQPNFRKLCESNACGVYDRSWMCPPLVGEVNQLIASLRRWRWAVVYQTVDTLEDSYDFEGMMATGEKMNQLTARIRRVLAGKEIAPVLLLGVGGCRVWASGRLSPPDSLERGALTEGELRDGLRLACRCQVLGDAQLRPAYRGAVSQICTAGEDTGPAQDPLFHTLGASVDIGTTTLAAQLYGPEGLLESAAAPNPQRTYGADVISRIGRAMTGDGPALASCIRRAVSALLEEMCRAAGHGTRELDGLVITGNTAMLHLITGTDPSPLAAAPFQARELFGKTIPAGTLELPCPPDALVYLPRCISAFVGGDITTALLVHHGGELHHSVPGGDGIGGVPVDHQGVGATGQLPDGLQNLPRSLNVGGQLAGGAGLGMDKNGAVMVLVGRLNVRLGHIHQMEATLGPAHLIPLGIIPVTGVDPAHSFHGQEYHQLEMGHMALNGFAAQSGLKCLFWRHETSSLIFHKN